MKISQTSEQIRTLAALQEKCEIQTVTLLSGTMSRAKDGSAFKAPFLAKPAISNVSSSCLDGTIVAEISFEYSAWDSSEPPERLFTVNCTFCAFR